jgi:hypothetical protein
VKVNSGGGLSIARRIFWGVSGTKTAPLHTDLIFSGLRRPIIHLLNPSKLCFVEISSAGKGCASCIKEILDFLYSERLKFPLIVFQTMEITYSTFSICRKLNSHARLPDCAFMCVSLYDSILSKRSVRNMFWCWCRELI